MTRFRPELSSVFVQVADVSRSRSFYEALGFEFHREDPRDGSAYARMGSCELILHPDLDTTLAGKERGAGANMVFSVDDADAYYRELRAAGIETAQEVEARPWGRGFWLRDPDGYILEFIGPKP